jgi:hypothetical protein
MSENEPVIYCRHPSAVIAILTKSEVNSNFICALLAEVKKPIGPSLLAYKELESLLDHLIE